MKALKSFYLEFNAIVKNVDSGINENQNGNGWVKGNKYNATYAGNTIISNGMKTWTIIKEDKTVYESDANDDNDGINPKKIMTIWETGFKNKYVKEELLNAETVHVINLTPKNPAKSDFTNITIYISKASNAMKKAVINSKDGTIMTYSVTKFESNPDVNDTKFVFEKKNYPGYPVIKD
jgi:outer membrane lipoprotein-sorting protein